MPRNTKQHNIDYIQSNVDLKTDVEIARDLDLSRERIRQYRVTYKIERRIFTLADAMAEIRKLKELIGST